MVVAQQTKKIICVQIDKGRKHDFRLYKESRLPILSNTKILADSGYQGIQKLHNNSLIPHKGKKRSPLSEKQKKENHQLSSTRVVVENVIRTLKIFRILAEKYRNRRKKYGLRLNLIAALCNLYLG